MVDLTLTKEVKTNEELVRENAVLREEVEELKRQLAVLKRAAFGQKSEKRAIETNPDQLSLFNEAEKEQSVSEREEEKYIVVNGHSRKKKRTRDEIFKDLPVCDRYDGYDKLKNVTRCGCWAHVRRKFYEALPLDEEIKKT